MNAGAYDLAVVGSGPGGCAAALTAARRGARVCLIERGPWGGVCLNVGCIPTKAMVAVGNLARRLRRAAEMGLRVHGFEVDFPAVMARNERIVSTLRRGLTELLQRDGVELIQGEAVFGGPRELLVTHEQRTHRLEPARIILACGARPAPGPWVLDERQVMSYRGLLSLTQLPASLLIVGGGVIGCEFASCFAALGTRVTLVEQQPRLLPSEDPEAVQWLVRRLESDGVAITTETTIQHLETSSTGVTASLSNGTQVTAERCLVAVGIQPDLEPLRLQTAGVTFRRGITVDPFLRTSQPHIAAIGDCLEAHGLAHWASAEGTLAARTLLGEPPESIDPAEVPRCVFTDPELAHIGPMESGADGDLRVSRLSFAAMGKSHCDGETEGFVKLRVDPVTDQVRAATIVGANASSLIHYAVLAIRHGLTARQLARTMTAHPTLPEAVTEAAANLYGESLYVAARPRARRGVA